MKFSGNSARSPVGPCSVKVCAACTALTAGVVFLLLGVWASHLYVRFTPVYTTITCHFEPPQVDKVSLADGLKINMVTTTVCDNPNPYSVEMTSTKRGEVYMGEDKTPVASVTKIPHSTLPANKKGKIEAHIEITPTLDMFSTGIDAIFGGSVPIYIENNMALDIDINFLFGRFRKVKDFNKDCGLNVKVGLGGSTVGPMGCADNWKELKVPAVGDAQPTTELKLDAASLAGDEIEKATEAKNIGLGIAMAVFYGLGLVFTVCGAVAFIRLRRAAAEGDDGMQSTRDIKIKEVAERNVMQEV